MAVSPKQVIVPYPPQGIVEGKTEVFTNSRNYTPNPELLQFFKDGIRTDNIKKKSASTQKMESTFLCRRLYQN